MLAGWWHLVGTSVRSPHQVGSATVSLALSRARLSLLQTAAALHRQGLFLHPHSLRRQRGGTGRGGGLSPAVPMSSCPTSPHPSHPWADTADVQVGRAENLQRGASAGGQAAPVRGEDPLPALQPRLRQEQRQQLPALPLRLLLQRLGYGWPCPRGVTGAPGDAGRGDGCRGVPSCTYGSHKDIPIIVPKG